MSDEQVVRFRRDLDGDFPTPVWPAGFSMRSFRADDAQILHTLLSEVFDDREEGPFDTWWQKVSNDTEFDPALCFLVFDSDNRLVAAALCWTSAYLKDLAVRPEARRRGLAEALLCQVFGTFQARGAAHLDLKTGLVKTRTPCGFMSGWACAAFRWKADRDAAQAASGRRPKMPFFFCRKRRSRSL